MQHGWAFAYRAQYLLLRAAKRDSMDAPDLVAVPPRRWSEKLGGIAWLPRLIDKARAALNGTLGGYLYGQSPMDAGLLKQLGLSHKAFAVIVKNAPDDDAVLAALIAHDAAAVERTRRWTDVELPNRHRLFLFLIDLDDGYLGGSAQKMKKAVNAGSNVFTALVKRVMPSNAIERALEE
jgi:hypothetical protein